MHRSVKLLILVWLVAIFPSAIGFSQVKDQKLANTLLWRITGKKLKQPSYLYGTMHLTDKRIFQLGDSLYRALEQTEGFAAELDMNQVGNQMVNQFLNEREKKESEESVKLKDAISPELWERYKSKLEDKFGKNADKLTVGDLDETESRLNADIFKKGDMPTFLDAWLSGQARRQGKWIGGIEDLEDQLEHKSNLEDKLQLALYEDEYYRKGVDWLMRLYIAQRLDSIDAMLYRESGGRKDYILIKRNVKMSRRMDSLAHIRSTLFAVGAAHLPGDSGVISLLRQRGYTVTPVFSSKKISADKYQPVGNAANWYPVSVTDSIYKLQMPGKAEGVTLFESMGLEMKMYFDISMMRVYFTANIPMPETRRTIGFDSIYAGLRKKYSANGKVLQERAVSINGNTGREFTIETEDGIMRMQLFIPGMEVLVLNAVFAFNEKGVTGDEADHFFQTFVFETGRKKKETGGKNWTQYQYPKYGFSIEMPVKPKEIRDQATEDGKVSFGWQNMEVLDQIFYGMSVSTMEEGMFDSGVDNDQYDALREQLRGSFESATISDSGFIWLNGYPGYRFTISGKSEGDEVESVIQSVSRGGISYYLYVVYAKGSASKNSAERYLSSLKLLPYQYGRWNKLSAPDNSFTSTSAFPFVLKEREADDESHPGAERFIIYDTVAYVSTYIDRTKLPDWLWYQSDTSFLSKRASNYFSSNDSVLAFKNRYENGLPTVDFYVVAKGDNVAKRVKLVLNGNELYEIFGHFSAQDLPNYYERFFEDFKPAMIKKAASGRPVNSRQLMELLKTGEEELVTSVKNWWTDLSFTGEDIPALRSMMLSIYPDFDTTYNDNLNGKIYTSLRDLDSNYSSIDFFRQHYGQISEKDEYVKPMIIGYLSEARTAASYAALKECLSRHPIRLKEKAPYFPNYMYDSLALTATLYPEMFEVGASRGLWHLVTGTATSLLDSGLLTVDQIRAHAQPFLITGKRVLEEESDAISEGEYVYYDLIRVLGLLNHPEAKSMLTKFSKYEDRQIRFLTLVAMLESGMTVDQKSIYTLASTDQYRVDLYDELKRLNKLSLFPRDFLSQQHMAQSRLYDYAADEDPPVGIVPIGTKNIMFKGKTQKVFLFKVTYDEGPDAEYFLGVAGPYAADTKDMSSNDDITGIYWEEALTGKNKDQLLDAYLKQLQED